MCYSAMIEADYRKYVRLFGATIDLREFVNLFWHRRHVNASLHIPKAMEAAFADPQTAGESEIKLLIDGWHEQQALHLQQLLFEQKTRLVEAERKLAVRPTQTWAEHRRIATKKIAWAHDKMASLRRPTLVAEDSRIYPASYAPVLVMENGRRVIKPMRYQCRPAGKPASHDRQFPGTYNARRDSLPNYWRGLFGVSHGIVVMGAFYEHVNQHRSEGRELAAGETPQGVVLEFRPQPAQDMLVACLWSHWQQPGQPALLSFAAITDEPPPEVAAAGHDRCIIPIKPEHIDAWLSPDTADLSAQYRILDDRRKPLYEHRLAA